MTVEELVVASLSASALALLARRRWGPALTWGVAAALFAGGGYLAAAASFLVESLFARWTDLWPGTRDGWLFAATMFVAVGLTEEACKLGVVLAADAWLDGRPRVASTAGIVLVAVGFAAFENFLYAAAFGAPVLVLRNVLSTGGHFACAWVQGRFLDLAAARPGSLWRAADAVVGLAAAALLHGALNIVL